jgi:hypothetical protein
MDKGNLAEEFIHYCIHPFIYLFSFEKGSHPVAQAGLVLMILLPQPPECWDCRYEPPCPAFLYFRTSNLSKCHLLRICIM